MRTLIRTRSTGGPSIRQAGPVALALALFLLVSCGDSGAGAEEDSASESSDTQEPTPSTVDTAAAFGVEEVEWPEDLAGAQALFDRMPERLLGDELRRPKYFGGSAGVSYGPLRGNATPSAWVMQTDDEIPDATAALSVMFGMTLACDKDTYRGTAPQGPYGGGPDADRSGDYPGPQLWWFSCTIDGAEGAPKFTGHALGWASGDLGWLVTTGDRDTTEALAKALISAA